MDGLRLFSVPAALIAVSADFFRRASTDVRAAMATVKDASDVLALLLAGGHSTIAGRLAGAFRNAGRLKVADDIVKTMERAGYTVRETDPFEEARQITLSTRDVSPYVTRIRLMWDAMREPVIGALPAAPGIPRNARGYLKAVDDIYVNDAYHSLSIEGYRVSPELIERVRSGAWNPEQNPQDREDRNALAARGYYDAYVSVKASVEGVLTGANAGEVSDDDHGDWYRQLFGPSVTAGIVKAVRSRRLPDRTGLHPALHARAAAARGGARLHAGAVRAAGKRAGAGRARRSRALRLRLRPSLHGWKRPHGPLPDERDARLWRISVDDHPARAAQRLHGRARIGERPAGHTTVCRVRGQARRGRPPRAEAAAGSAGA